MVGKGGRKKTTDAKSGIAVGAVALEVAQRSAAKAAKKKDSAFDFYRFQHREARRNGEGFEGPWHLGQRLEIFKQDYDDNKFLEFDTEFLEVARSVDWYLHISMYDLMLTSIVTNSYSRLLAYRQVSNLIRRKHYVHYQHYYLPYEKWVSTRSEE